MRKAYKINLSSLRQSAAHTNLTLWEYLNPGHTTGLVMQSSVFVVMICIAVIGLQVIEEEEFFCTLSAPYLLSSLLLVLSFLSRCGVNS